MATQLTAPPSAGHTITSEYGELAQGLTQAQADGETLANLLANWPSDLPADLQPVVQIQARLVQYLAVVASGLAAVATAAGVSL